MDLDVGIIDLQVGLFDGEPQVPLPKELLRDEESLRHWPSLDVVKYMFGDTGRRKEEASDVTSVLRLMDEYGIDQAQVPISPATSSDHLSLIDKNSDRLFAVLRLDPHTGFEAVRQLDDLGRRFKWIRSVTVAPAILYPPLPPNSKEFFPIYSKCIELDIPVLLNVGFPGPRVPGEVQDPMYLDEVAWFFPELRIVMKHGGEPWADLCVRLLMKWPNLYYATTGFAPARYPAPIVRYLQGRGTGKILYGGYFPSLGLDRIMTELSSIDLPRADSERFLRTNALDVFRLEPR